MHFFIPVTRHVDYTIVCKVLVLGQWRSVLPSYSTLYSICNNPPQQSVNSSAESFFLLLLVMKEMRLWSVTTVVSQFMKVRVQTHLCNESVTGSE